MDVLPCHEDRGIGRQAQPRHRTSQLERQFEIEAAFKNRHISRMTRQSRSENVIQADSVCIIVSVVGRGEEFCEIDALLSILIVWIDYFQFNFSRRLTFTILDTNVDKSITRDGIDVFSYRLNQGAKLGLMLCIGCVQVKPVQHRWPLQYSSTIA